MEPFHHPPNNSDLDIEVRINPGKFRDIQPPITQINDKWFINLSSVAIPNDVQNLLQFGDNFSLPVCNTEKLTIEFIKNIEHNLRRLPPVTQSAIRNRTAHIVNNIAKVPIPKSNVNLKIKQLLSTTKEFLKRNDNLILTRADKGNVTVALDKDKYVESIEEILRDTDTYIRINKDPTRKLTNSIRDLLTRWSKSDFISRSTHKRIFTSDGVLSRAYGLPKIHKPNCPFRLIVSSLNSPTYALAAFLHRTIHESLPAAHSHVANSFKLVERLSKIHLSDNFELISLDVVSLFTNVPTEMVLDSICVRWHLISKKCKIPRSEFLIAVRLVLNSTFFTFNSIIYQQIFGSPMSSPLSPTAVDIVMQDLEASALATLKYTPPFFVRYVDDIALATPSSSLDHTLEVFNSFHPRLQFTVEVGEGGRLNFLEITMIRRNNRIIFDWFHKPTFSGRYLNFVSQHPVCQKRGTVISLIDRVFLLSHPSFHSKNLELAVQILLNNCYPLDFIFRNFHERIKSLINRVRSETDRSPDVQPEEAASFFTIPYIPHINDQYRNILKNHKLRLSYYSLNKMQNCIKTHKDALPKFAHSNVVYKINCGDCDASYVGQTGRQLQTRIKEHQAHIRRNTTSRSVITEQIRVWS
ncbi:uncharacterized protein LOC143893802 [Temnothorax americanus]|uniref:uncharacterized protein LOC143893802 n=1 Tax=Temnothorax americanus TaxID=1964332 RepID=UPI004068FBF6